MATFSRIALYTKYPKSLSDIKKKKNQPKKPMRQRNLKT